MGIRTVLPASLTLIVAVALALAPEARAARRVDGAVAPPSARSVGSVAGFEAAVTAMRTTGGTITLGPGRYPTKMRIGPRSSRRLIITGPPGGRAVVRAIVLNRTQAVTIHKLHVRAMVRDGGIHTIYSRHIKLHNLTFTAIDTTRKVGINLDHSNHVTVDDSVFAHCGDNTPRWSMCILPRYASNVIIEDNRFHDCLGCDFIHGRAGPNLLIKSNTFNRALACHHTWEKCGHQDMIELFLANGMTVRDNIFGVNEFGGAQLYMALAVDHVRVARQPVPGVRSAGTDGGSASGDPGRHQGRRCGCRTTSTSSTTRFSRDRRGPTTTRCRSWSATATSGSSGAWQPADREQHPRQAALAQSGLPTAAPVEPQRARAGCRLRYHRRRR